MGKKPGTSTPLHGDYNPSDRRQVRLLLRRPECVAYPLPEIEPGSSKVKWVTVGSAAHCDLVVEGAEDMHCSLECTAHGVTVHPRTGAKTMVNKAILREGHTELFRGAVLTLGNVRLVACKDISDREYYTVRGLNDMIHESMALHGNNNAQAAKTLGASPRTFFNWHQRDKFKIGASLAALCIVLGLGWSWTRGDEHMTREANRPLAASEQPVSGESAPAPAVSAPAPAASAPIPATSTDSAATDETTAARITTTAHEPPRERARTHKRRDSTVAKDAPTATREPTAAIPDEQPEARPRFLGAAQDVEHQLQGGAYDVELARHGDARDMPGVSE